MKINEALKIIYNDEEYDTDDIEWQKAFNEITESLGVYWDDKSDNFITKDTGHVI